MMPSDAVIVAGAAVGVLALCVFVLIVISEKLRDIHQALAKQNRPSVLLFRFRDQLNTILDVSRLINTHYVGTSGLFVQTACGETELRYEEAPTRQGDLAQLWRRCTR